MAPTFARTPESLISGLKRTDSKNPLTTCRGITGNGRPCRRSLAAAVNALNANQTDEESSVVAMLEDDEIGSEITAFFCWQHKDQADSYHVGRARKVELKTRSSLEDMMSSMGLQDSQHIRTALRKQARAKPMKAIRGQNPTEDPAYINSSTQRGDIVINDNYEASNEKAGRNAHTSSETHAKRSFESRRRKEKRPSFWDMLCGCHTTATPGDDSNEFPRPQHQRPSTSAVQAPKARRTHSRNDSKLEVPVIEDRVRRKSAPVMQIVPDRASQPDLQRPPNRPALREIHSQPVTTRRPYSDRTSGHKGRSISAGPGSTPSYNATNPIDDAWTVIPPNASITLASALLAEMGKISQDHRQGHIYMYWLDEAQHDHADDDGQSLLLASSPRRASTTATASPPRTKKLLLKIGRAENVHRRLAQWQLQCGYKPLLVRSYPRADADDDATGKVRHLHRVERLIQIELAERNVRRRCVPCGKEHREWFEVDGREGVREVHGIIEKWVAWSGRQPDG